MANRWTKEQNQVIEHRGGNLLVSAAAGSGKTAVMIERIIKMVTDKENPVDIDRLLVVTFTNAAAGEMKERIKKRIVDLLEVNNEDENLKRQLLLLDTADITTIDSFCKNIVKKDFHKVGVDADFSIGDPDEMEILAGEVLDNLFEDLYDEGDKDMLLLSNSYSENISDNNLAELILKVSRFVDSSPFPDKWLDTACRDFENSESDKIAYMEDELEFIEENIFFELEYAVDVLEESIEYANDFIELFEYSEIVEEKKEDIKELCNEIERFSYIDNTSTLEYEIDIELIYKDISKCVYDILNKDYSSFRIGSKEDPFVKEVYKEIKGEVDQTMKMVLDILSQINIDIEDKIEEDKVSYPYMRALSNIVKKYRVRFQEEKRKIGVLDFSDIEHYALEILSFEDDDEIYPSEIARIYQDKYIEVFTDEYQDSNLVQEYILQMVSKSESPNRFMVGDVKQSIYRFRHARPEIFLEKYHNYNAYDEFSDSKNKKINLYKNFRSRKEVLAATNYIFEKIMSESTGEIDYTEEEYLNYGGLFPKDDIENTANSVDIKITASLDEDEDLMKMIETYIKDNNIDIGEDIDTIIDNKNFALECFEIANTIENMVDKKGQKVYDPEIGGYRVAKYSDITILMRSTSGKMDMLEKILSGKNIPVISPINQDYFKSFEIETIINILRVIDNPISDIPLLSAMRSPIFGFESEELARIRIIDKGRNFYELLLILREDRDLKSISIGEEDNPIDSKLYEKVVYFFDTIEKYRDMSKNMYIHELFWNIIKNTGYLNYISLLENGEQRKRNIMYLFERARIFESGSYKSLFSFIEYIERLKSKKIGIDISSNNVQEDGVNISTIHKSKGLEYPIVIVANSSKKFNISESKEIVNLHMDLGYGPTIIDSDNMVKFDSYRKKRILIAQKKEQIAEEMRLLYVAMTRAKEKLVFTGVVKDFDTKKDKWKKLASHSEGEAYKYSVIKMNNYLDWIMSSLYFLIKDDIEVDKKDISIYDGDLNISIEAISGIMSMVDYFGIERDSFSEYVNEIADKDNSSDGNIDEDSIAVFDSRKNMLTKNIELLKLAIKDTDGILEKEQCIKESIEKEYRFKDISDLPSTITVTQIKDNIIKSLQVDDTSEIEEEGEILKVNDEKIIGNPVKSTLKTPRFMVNADDGKEFSSAERGSILHLVVQLLDIEKLYMKKDNAMEEIESQIDSMVQRKIISKEEAKTVNRYWILRLSMTDIFEKMVMAQKENRLFREKVFTQSVSVDYPKNNEEDRMILMGVVDAFIIDENGDIIIIDYKTDYVTEDTLDSLVEKYRIQLDTYEKALEGISGRNVIAKYIYPFRIGRFVKV